MTPSAEYVPGIGWMVVTKNGRYGNFETEAAALSAAVDVLREQGYDEFDAMAAVVDDIQRKRSDAKQTAK